MVRATDQGESGSTQPVGSAEDHSREKAVMETLETEEGESSRVNLKVSHMGLTENLYPLGGTRTFLRMLVQGQSCRQKKKIEKVLKDMTN